MQLKLIGAYTESTYLIFKAFKKYKIISSRDTVPLNGKSNRISPYHTGSLNSCAQ